MMEHLNKILHFLVWGCIFCLPVSTFGQSLLDELNQESFENDTIYAEATFKAPRLINGQSVETVGKNGLNFIISHRFGNLNTGIDEFYGLDESHIRLGLEYGLTNAIDLGIGRSREQKLVDGYAKIKLLRQSEGAKFMPVTLTWYSAVAIRTDDGRVAGRDYTLVNKLNYIHQLLIARKFNDRLSVQLMLGVVHRNLVENHETPNVVPYTGFGGRFKVTSRVAINAEYYYNWDSYINNNFVNPLSIGVDIETGGHIFQLHVSNTRAMQEKIMIAENTNKWTKGDMGFGFNIIRHFNLKR